MPKLCRSAISWLVLAILMGGGVSAYFLIFRKSPPTTSINEEAKPDAPPLPEPGSPLYEKYVDAFWLGVAAMDEEEQDQFAEEQLNQAIELIPGEPAAWANRGLLHLRHRKLEQAEADMSQAKKLAPESAEIERMLGRLAEGQVQFPAAADHYRRVVELDPKDAWTRFALARVLMAQSDRREPDPEKDQECQRHLESILESQPHNLYVLKDHLEVSARRRDLTAFRQSVERIRPLSSHWSADARKRFEFTERLASGPLPAEVPGELYEFLNVLQSEPGYVRNRRAVAPGDNYVGEGVEHFLRLAPLRPTPAPPDLQLAFTIERLGGFPKDDQDRWNLVLPVWLDNASKPTVLVANGREARFIDAIHPALPFPGGPKNLPPSRCGIVAVDWNNDYRMDFLFAGAGGLRFYQLGADGRFTDVTQRTGLDKVTIEADYYGAWVADYDLDGDLDIIAARRTGPPVALRNNRDGTFKVVEVFPEVNGARAFVWADFDNDGAPDAAFLDAQGRLHVFANQRSGLFTRRKVPADLPLAVSLAVADLSHDGAFDLLLLGDSGQILRLTNQEKGKSWKVGKVVEGSGLPDGFKPGSSVLLVADIDNNGSQDLVVSDAKATSIWLSNGTGNFQGVASMLPGNVFAAMDLKGEGRLDLLALSDEGQPLRLVNRGSKPYHWQSIRPLANYERESTGDNRINSFGIGGEVEVRTGTHVQKQPITRPIIHFGLGDRRTSDAVRILWPNGIPQVDYSLAGKKVVFGKPANQVIAAKQILKGSCPFLFAYNGRCIDFVTDFMWSTPLGMYINAQDKGGFLQTTDWVKIRGDQLVPRDGVYDLRVTANLWETHYYDHMALIVVDHPPGSEVYVDERFFLTPTEPQVYVTEPPRPVARASDQNGRDVTDVVRAIDGKYLDTCGRGQFQGITHDHWVEIDLGDDAPTEGPLWLVAHGWVHPTDSSVNFAIEQGHHDRPRGLELEIPDGHGGWKVGRPALGFPAGKNKTILIRIDGIEGKNVTRRFRLRTNMEIYWDALAYARGLDSGLAHQQRLLPDSAELRFHGIVIMTCANPSSPEIPHYDRLVRRGQYWRDLIGYYTRYGDVRELLATVDDRYVIMNAGDEIAFQFRAPPEPPDGWERDFVWVCDGWAKDGDLNTRFSKTVLPLPGHDLTTYVDPPGRLEDDPIYRRFPEDWKKFHTRFVNSDVFEQGLRSFRRPSVVP